MDYDQCLPEYKYLFQPNLLQGKVAFITGGGSGIGFTITEILMRHGCNAVIASRSKERVDAAAAKLVKATGQRCLALQMDVRKPQDIINAFDETLKTYSRLDILVNNAAGNFLSPVSGLSFNAFKTVMEIDAFGTFNCSKVAYEKYLRDHGGVIVNISANIHKKGVVLQAHVGAAKAAIDALTKHLAVEWGANKIRVVGLAPGPIDNTEGMRRLTGINKMNQDNEQLQKIPLGRRGTKVDMAHCVLFLVSDAGSYVTGETLVADGGSWLASSNSWHDAIQRMETVQAATQNQRRPSRL